METNKKNNSIIAVIILAILVVVLGGYIVYDKLLNNNDTNSLEENLENDNISTNEVIDVKKENGECPLTNFDNTYILTDKDKEDILNSLEKLNAGFDKEKIDINSFSIIQVSESGYYIDVNFDVNPKTSQTYASVAKVNGKFKVLTAGSADDAYGIQRMEDTLKSICK